MENKIFIGAKALRDEQVKLIVPTFDTLMEQIEEMRKQAKGLQGREVTAQFNNTIGLFGGRGTGKSSTIMTIKEKLKESFSNIILDTIEPDNFGKNTKIMGAIIGLFKDQVERIEEHIKSVKKHEEHPKFFNDCKFMKKNILRQKYQQMLEAYCYTEDEYRSLLTSEFTDFETFKNKYSEVLKPDIELERKINNFYNQLIETMRKENKEEPLIFIFIDDVDLKTSKCKEVIDSIMKYTCHPNVVCILSGDYEILNEAITLSLMESEKLAQDYQYGTADLFNDSRNFEGDFSLFDRKKYLTHEYLKKILPPAFRHNVVTWNLENIPMFSFFEEYGNENNNSFLYEKLIEVFGVKSLFSPLNNERTEFLKVPFNIFDKTPRGIVNVYYQLSKFKNEFDGVNDKYLAVKGLIESIINSSKDLTNHKSILEEIIIWGSDIKSSKIIFTNIIKRIDQNEDMNKKLKVKVFLDCFLVCFLVKELINDISTKDYNIAKKYFMYYLLSNMDYMNSDTIINISGKREFIENKRGYWRVDRAIRAFLIEIPLENSIRLVEKIAKNAEYNRLLTLGHKDREVQDRIFELFYDVIFEQSDGEEGFRNLIIEAYNQNQILVNKVNDNENNTKIDIIDFMKEISQEQDWEKTYIKVANQICENMEIFRVAKLGAGKLVGIKKMNMKTIKVNRKLGSGANGFTLIANHDIVREKELFDKYIIPTLLNSIKIYVENEFKHFQEIEKKHNITQKEINKIKTRFKIFKSKEKQINSNEKYRKMYLDLVEEDFSKLKEYVSKYLFIGEKVTESGKEVIILLENSGEIQKFLHGDKGKSSKYYECISKIGKYFEESEKYQQIKLSDFIDIIFEVEELIKNPRIKYGYNESHEFSRFLREKAVIFMDLNDKSGLWRAIREYSDFMRSQDKEGIRTDIIENKKSEIRRLIKLTEKELRDEDQKILDMFYSDDDNEELNEVAATIED